MHSFLHSHPPPSPGPYNNVHHVHYTHSHNIGHGHHPSLSINSFTSPPTIHQLTQVQTQARQGQPSPGPGSTQVGAVTNTAHWAQQMMRADDTRQASTAHYRAKLAAKAPRGPSKTAIPITNPNGNSLIGMENGHGRDTSISSLITDSSSAAEHSNASNDPEHPSSTSAPIVTAPRPTAVRKVEESWTMLDMGGMQLKHLSKGLFNFSFLTTLYLNHNHLLSLPNEIARLRNLVLLDLSGNQLTTVTPAIGMLSSLRELLLFDNRLTTLPGELGSLHKLHILGIEGNPLDSKYRAIAQKEGTVGLIAWLRDHSPPSEEPQSRQWVSSLSDQDRAALTSDPNTVRFNVLCYNILCEKYATSNLYGYTPSWALQWSYRKERILKEIRDLDCDIVCLQEVDLAQYEEFFCTALHPAGWESTYNQKGRAKTMSETKKREVDGCATFFRSEKFSLVETEIIEFHSVAMKSRELLKSDEMFNRVVKRDDMAVVSLLEERATGARLIVVNAHIYWDPEFRDVKMVQVGVLMQELQKIADRFATWPPVKLATGAQAPTYSEGVKIPTLICGDFNSVPESGVVQFLSEGLVRGDHPDWNSRDAGKFTSDGMKHRFNLKSTYSVIGELPFTNYTPSFSGVIDYMWFTSNSIAVTDVLGEVDNEYISKVVGFPNAHFPSDHILLSAEFVLKPPKEQAKNGTSGPPGLRLPN